jgi:hypothetical protein
MPTQEETQSVTVNKAKEIKFSLPALDVVIVGKWIWVSGTTYPVRQQLVALGLRYSSDKSKWYWKPAGQFFKGVPKPYEAISEKYGELRVQPIQQVA